ncbi:MAG TPA: 6-carboxytetrahydropterin synthase QueD [Bdellovibrionota bacterium]|nr:6-carboxytetrahydropterin synthase QueD [Bdellovibrionota bacterium]
MFELRVEVEFPAGHYLPGYPGDCSRMHGHNWVLEVFARSRQLDSVGMAIDFRALKSAVKALAASWDHENLNEHPDFKDFNPTAENIARLAFERLSVAVQKIGNGAGWIDRVTVWENPHASATYFREGQ